MIKVPYYETSHFVFSNFSPHPVGIDGMVYPTAEHAYHAAKFVDINIKSEIKNASTPLEAYKLGKKYKPQRKENWDEIKRKTLYHIIKEKVDQHNEVKEALLATGAEEIIEDNPHNEFWGNGKDGKGQNEMGKILMEVREELTS